MSLVDFDDPHGLLLRELFLWNALSELFDGLIVSARQRDFVAIQEYAQIENLMLLEIADIRHVWSTQRFSSEPYETELEQVSEAIERVQLQVKHVERILNNVSDAVRTTMDVLFPESRIDTYDSKGILATQRRMQANSLSRTPGALGV